MPGHDDAADARLARKLRDLSRHLELDRLDRERAAEERRKRAAERRAREQAAEESRALTRAWWLAELRARNAATARAGCRHRAEHFALWVRLGQAELDQ